MNTSDIEQKLSTIQKDDIVGFVKIVLWAMNEQRNQDARLIGEFGDQLPEDHPAKHMLHEISDALYRQKIE